MAFERIPLGQTEESAKVDRRDTKVFGVVSAVTGTLGGALVGHSFAQPDSPIAPIERALGGPLLCISLIAALFAPKEKFGVIASSLILASAAASYTFTHSSDHLADPAVVEWTSAGFYLFGLCLEAFALTRN